MRKIISIICVALLLICNLYPAYANAKDTSASIDYPTKPYEKIIAKNGEWYTDRVQFDNTSNLVIGYKGKFESQSPVSELSFKVNEKVVVTGIYLPIIGDTQEIPSVEIVDEKGNIAKGFNGKKEINTSLKPANELKENNSERYSLVYTSNSEIVFNKGIYTLKLSIPDIAVGDYLLKGINYEGNEKYNEELRKLAMKDIRETIGEQKDTQGSNEVSVSKQNDTISITGEKVIGDDKLVEGVAVSFEPLQQDGSKHKKPAYFGLDAEYGIDEILINTYNDGKGVLPGTISIADENGSILYTEQASGNTFSNVPNGMWRIAPRVLLPEGMYSIVISNPEAWTYDENMEPLFYVKASIPVQERYNFTGTYMINLESYKTSTLMGKVSSKESSFSLKDFELTVLDRGTSIELIGKYENIPFSQMCEIVEETDDTVSGKFNFKADLSKLPYKAVISTNLNILLEKQGSNGANIKITGDALYTREASKDKGADINTYDIEVKGALKQKELPPFVLTALGKSSSVGNIPGPDNATEAATGMLFPPLVGLVVNIVTEIIKKKDTEEALQKAAQKAASKKGIQRDKAWYAKQYPGKTDEQLAMIMLADAMGNTDEPDEGDLESIGDNEIADAKAAKARAEQEAYVKEQAERESEYEAEQAIEEAKREEEDKRIEEEAKTVATKEAEKDTAEAEQKKQTEETTQEPETMVLQTSANGAQELYVKDPNTGKWHNAETGNELDYEDYKNRVVNDMKENKEWNDAEFEKNSKGEMTQDKINREKMREIKEDEKYEAYLEELRKKYHIEDEDDLWDFIEAKQELDKENADKWNMIGDINAAGEVGAKVVSTGADIGVDILAEATGPAGKGIKAGYKVLKSTAGNVAEKQVTREGGATLGDAFEGAIKGAGDAATDFISTNSKYVDAAAKATTNIVSETTGSMVGAAMNDEDVIEAGKAGLVDGVTKATVNTVSDAIGGDTPEIPKDVGIKDAMKKVIINKSTATKVTTAVADEVAIKPATDEIKDFIKNEKEKK